MHWGRWTSPVQAWCVTWVQFSHHVSIWVSLFRIVCFSWPDTWNITFLNQERFILVPSWCLFLFSLLLLPVWAYFPLRLNPAANTVFPDASSRAWRWCILLTILIKDMNVLLLFLLNWDGKHDPVYALPSSTLSCSGTQPTFLLKLPSFYHQRFCRNYRCLLNVKTAEYCGAVSLLRLSIPTQVMFPFRAWIWIFHSKRKRNPGPAFETPPAHTSACQNDSG